MKHSDQWMVALFQGLDEHTDEATRRAILERCGRTCFGAGTRAARARRAAARGVALDEVLAILNEDGVGGGHLEASGGDGRTIVGRYDRCYCPLAKDAGSALSPTFCECTRGWAKALFETVFSRPVEVKLLESVRRGGKACRFEVTLS